MNCCDDHSNKEKKEGIDQEQNKHTDHESPIRTWYIFGTLGVIIAMVAVTFFKVSVQNLLYIGIFLACPLMHIFMMKGHTGHNHQDSKAEK